MLFYHYVLKIRISLSNNFSIQNHSPSNMYSSAGSTKRSPNKARTIIKATNTPNKIVGISDAKSIALKPKISINEVKITALPDCFRAKSILF